MYIILLLYGAWNNIACNAIGFSSLISRPVWQTQYVDGYFQSLTSDQELAAGYASGRGIPDVSLLGNNYLVDIGGSPYLVSG